MSKITIINVNVYFLKTYDKMVANTNSNYYYFLRHFKNWNIFMKLKDIKYRYSFFFFFLTICFSNTNH